MESFDPLFLEKEEACLFFRCKYIVLTEDFDNSIGLNVNPWRRGESSRYALSVKRQIEKEWLESFKDHTYLLDLFGDKSCGPISYEYALNFYEANKSRYSSLVGN